MATIKERLINLEDIIYGHESVETIKQLSRGTAEGTANFMQEMSLWKLDICKKFDKIEGHIERLINILEKKTNEN